MEAVATTSERLLSEMDRSLPLYDAACAVLGRKPHKAPALPRADQTQRAPSTSMHTPLMKAASSLAR